MYLDLTPVKSFLHCASKKSCPPSPLGSPPLERAASKAAAESTAETVLTPKEAESCTKAMEISEQVLSGTGGVGLGLISELTPHTTSSCFISPQKHPEKPELDEVLPRMPAVKIQTQQQNIAFPQPAPELPAGKVTAGSPQLVPAHRPKMPLPGEWAVQAASRPLLPLGLGGRWWCSRCEACAVVHLTTAVQ